ncbi:MAG TPA: hypothetical protein VM093_02305 [Aeromicrobium sp.]|nr:hypothetical protein [Aeromicrobium sp.]
MERRLAVLGIAAMVVILALSAWFDLSGRRDEAPGARPSVAPSAGATATARPTSKPDDAIVKRNRNERRGPSWSPADVVGKDGKPLTLGHAVPGAFEPVEAGVNIQEAMDTGFIEPDRNREQPCPGLRWKWKGQLASGLDVIVDPDKQVVALGMSKDGLETPEGISIGNSYGALKKTYGNRLQGPVRMDYGQAGAFLRDGDRWIGFGMDNEPGRLADSSRIAFIEVTRGTRPGLLRDGC